MQEMPFFRASKGVSKEDIQNAEHVLNIIFAKDYKEYLTMFGSASVNGHELTGIHSSKRLNVVDVTLLERKRHEFAPKAWYVLEQAHIDDIVIWQNEKGEVFQTSPGNEPIKIASSIIEYLSLDEE